MIPQEVEPDVYSYIGGICRRMDSSLLAMGGISDHVHMLISLGKTVALSDLMLHVKRDSSKWLKKHDHAFEWQDGYFAFSNGESGTDALRAYIAGQQQHHERTDFKDEVRTLLRKYKVEFDERHIWE